MTLPVDYGDESHGKILKIYIQVGWWDTRRGGEPVSMCPPHVAHRDLVRNVLFINSKTGAEFFSSSPDGVVKW